ncbi:hypothetical protein DFH94DRAFT_856184, partial [Russula ochroleuca]
MPPSTLISIDDSSVSGATHHLDTSSVLHARRVSTPILIDGPSGSRETRTSNVLHVHRVSSCDNCRVTINILPDDVLLLIFHFDRLKFLDGLPL